MAEARIASPEPQPQAQTTESQAQTPEQSSVALTASFAGDGALAANVDIVQHHTVQFASEGTLQAYISPQQPATNMNAATLNYNNSTGQQLPIPARVRRVASAGVRGQPHERRLPLGGARRHLP